MKTSLVFLDAEQFLQFPSGVRHERCQQPGELSNCFQEMMQNFADPRSLFRILEQYKRRSLNDVSITLVDRSPNGLERPVKLKLCHMPLHFALGSSEHIPELLIFFG